VCRRPESSNAARYALPPLALVYLGLRLATMKLRGGKRSSGSGSNLYLRRLRQRFGLAALGPGDCPTVLPLPDAAPYSRLLGVGIRAALRVRAQPGGAIRLCHSRIPRGAANAPVFGSLARNLARSPYPK
jgi:hypothetical protein